MRLRPLLPFTVAALLAACGPHNAPANSPQGVHSEKLLADEKLSTDERELWTQLSSGIVAEAHGDPANAVTAMVRTLKLAQKSETKLTPMIAWIAADRLARLRDIAPRFEDQLPALGEFTRAPGALGWRAILAINALLVVEADTHREVLGKEEDDRARKSAGCLNHLRAAGPFGHGVSADRLRHFPAERPGPWPSVFPLDPQRKDPPRILETVEVRCTTAAKESLGRGIYFMETFVDVKEEKDAIVSASNATGIWIDDALVLERDPNTWGAWLKQGVAVRLTPGRHRFLARVTEDRTTLRALSTNGSPLNLESNSDPARPYVLAKPVILPDPNPLATVDFAASPVHAFLYSYGAHLDGLDDVASNALDPILLSGSPSPIIQEFAAVYARGDAGSPEDVRASRERELRTKAVAADPKLWLSRAWMLFDLAEQRGAEEIVGRLRALTEEFPSEPDLLLSLSRITARLGWRAVRLRTLQAGAKAFPKNVAILRQLLAALDEYGDVSLAEEIAKSIAALDPDAEVALERAIARRDWPRAISELRRLGARRPDRKDLARKMADLLARSGDPNATIKVLKEDLARRPLDAEARMRLTDLEFAGGNVGALRRSLADALAAGASTSALREAVALLEGTTAFEPYRKDGKQIIAAYEAWEKKGHRMEGMAARVLDYSVVWAHPDGSSEMLEHEIQRMQSQEAVQKESEQRPPEGLVLRVRVVKPDGRVYEPEIVEGKQTLTMPHLEVGDYLEVEHIMGFDGEQQGQTYVGPRWFFREADKGYWQSEFVVVAPADRPLEIESIGTVPEEKRRTFGTFVERRWRAIEMAPAPNEPDAVPVTEFLPSVRIGWGVSLPKRWQRYVDLVAERPPIDPRMEKLAKDLVVDIGAKSIEARAQRIYRWVLDHIEEGKELDGRRILRSKTGSRREAFLYLAHILNIPVEMAVAHNRLAPPSQSQMAEAEAFDALVLRLETDHGVRWITIGDKFAPFGYVPAELRGEECVRLVEGLPHEKIPSLGESDAVELAGSATLDASANATLDIAFTYRGKLGSQMRTILTELGEGRRNDFIEGRILGRYFPGARLDSLKVEHEKDLDEPLTLNVRAKAALGGESRGKGISLKPIFAFQLGQLARLAKRETALLMGSASHIQVSFDLKPPAGYRIAAGELKRSLIDGPRSVTIDDHAAGPAFHLTRVIDLPAGRVLPGDAYTKFAAWTRSVDEAYEHELVLQPGSN